MPRVVQSRPCLQTNQQYTGYEDRQCFTFEMCINVKENLYLLVDNAIHCFSEAPVTVAEDQRATILQTSVPTRVGNRKSIPIPELDT